MKNQYFGDVNDFFKFDLVLTLVEELSGGRSFTFVPMLTPADNSADGRITRYNGTHRPELARFLKECAAAEPGEPGRTRRNIVELRRFCRMHGNLYHPYHDDDRMPEAIFSHATRADYFEGIPQVFLKNAVILLDPDNGIEVPGMRTGTGHKYVTYGEISSLCRRMSDDSLLLVYQHLPRIPRRPYIEERCGDMMVKSGINHVIAIWNCRIAFFIVAKEAAVIATSHRIVERLVEASSAPNSRCRYHIHPRQIQR